MSLPVHSLLGSWIRFPNACIETCVQSQNGRDLSCHQYCSVWICIDSLEIVFGTFALFHFSWLECFLCESYMCVVLVPCVRTVPCQADYHMRSLPRLAHDGREDLYWARVSLMPRDGQMFSV